MKSIWPGQPGGYVPVAWVSLMKAAAIRERAKAAHKKQECFTNLKKAKK